MQIKLKTPLATINFDNTQTKNRQTRETKSTGFVKELFRKKSDEKISDGKMLNTMKTKCD
jgi:hypothetical protein